jgi:hypothetical protein
MLVTNPGEQSNPTKVILLAAQFPIVEQSSNKPLELDSANAVMDEIMVVYEIPNTEKGDTRKDLSATENRSVNRRITR